MNKKKQILCTAAGIFFICLLFMLAMVFPEYYTSYTDKKLLERVEYVDISYNAYEVVYNSFAEKLNAIGKMSYLGNINSVKIDNREIVLNYKNINTIIKKEFKKLSKYGLLYNERIRLRKGKIILCEKYIIYPSGGKDDIKGVTYIKVVYKTKKGNIEVYIDEEYHKIYAVQMPYDLYLGYASKIKDYGISTNESVFGYDEIDSSYFEFINGLLKYYYNNKPSAEINYYTILDAYYSGGLICDNGIVLEAGRRKFITSEGFEVMQIGIYNLI